MLLAQEHQGDRQNTIYVYLNLKSINFPPEFSFSAKTKLYKQKQAETVT